MIQLAIKSLLPLHFPLYVCLMVVFSKGMTDQICVYTTYCIHFLKWDVHVTHI